MVNLPSNAPCHFMIAVKSRELWTAKCNDQVISQSKLTTTLTLSIHHSPCECAHSAASQHWYAGHPLDNLYHSAMPGYVVQTSAKSRHWMVMLRCRLGASLTLCATSRTTSWLEETIHALALYEISGIPPVSIIRRQLSMINIGYVVP